MERQIRNIVVWILLLMPAGLLAQEILVLDLEFSRDEFRIVQTEEGRLSLEALDDDYYYGVGADIPALPLRTVRVLVPNGAEFSGLDYSSEEILISGSTFLEPVPALRTLSERSGISADPPRSVPYTGSFPEHVITYTGTGIQRGYTWFSFQVSPFIYNGRPQDRGKYG
jgi:hypothetical protein